MDASLSSLYQHAPPPSHYPYYHEPPSQHPPPAHSRSLQLLPAYSLSQQPLPPPASHYALHPPAPHHDEVRTLFIAGLSDDCKSREIYNLFREFPGYQSSYLRTSTESSRPYAFAVFDDHQSAVAALEALNGFIFDLEKDSTLYIELAKSNSKSSQRPRRGIGSNMHMSGKGSSAYNMYDNPSTQSHTSFDHVDAHNADPKTQFQGASRAYVPQNNPPCPTLFMANLGPTCSEQELTQILSNQENITLLSTNEDKQEKILSFTPLTLICEAPSARLDRRCLWPFLPLLHAAQTALITASQHCRALWHDSRALPDGRLGHRQRESRGAAEESDAERKLQRLQCQGNLVRKQDAERWILANHDSEWYKRLEADRCLAFYDRVQKAQLYKKSQASTRSGYDFMEKLLGTHAIWNLLPQEASGLPLRSGFDCSKKSKGHHAE
ncbi:hypothetical protein KSP40_PGU012133 [Platanthera guangdongensis]|uniref:RRM domain-containing protein n=1 Tax=Platanthera guangdongensis TaxID=2320717 RepID=A0ABR2MV32_9ASPA